MIGFRRWVVDNLGAAIMFVSGSIGLLPHRVPVTAVVGLPIVVEKTENPSNELIAATHKAYVEALIGLYDANKALYGYGDKKLIID